MKRKSVTLFSAMTAIFVAMTFQSCPGHMSPEPETDIYAYVYHPEDSVYVRFYTLNEDQLQQHEMYLGPSKTVRPFEWYSGYITLQERIIRQRE